jgi:hypothetical protein
VSALRARGGNQWDWCPNSGLCVSALRASGGCYLGFEMSFVCYMLFCFIFCFLFFVLFIIYIYIYIYLYIYIYIYIYI